MLIIVVLLVVIYICSSPIPSVLQAEPLEDAITPEMDFPLTLSNMDTQEQEAEVLQPPDPELTAPCPTRAPLSAPDKSPEHQPSTFVSCDHNYTVEDTVQQKKRIDQLEEQLDKLRKKLKTVRQKCRRQERQLERFKALGDFPKAGKGLALGESYVILPKELFIVLKGIDAIDGLWGGRGVSLTSAAQRYCIQKIFSWLLFYVWDLRGFYFTS